ncbi:MAG: hypothetical protein Tsb0021_16520 [Chlamydiales bacterium]
MEMTISFIRTLFTVLCVLLSATYATHSLPGGITAFNLTTGIVAGLGTAGILIAFDLILRTISIQSFNVAALGLLFGYLMGLAFFTIFQTILDVSGIAVQGEVFSLLKLSIFFMSIYLGMIITFRSHEELQLSIPFIRLKRVNHKKKDVVVDGSCLLDTRIIDLASSGLLDHHLVLPRFVLKDLYQDLEVEDESTRNKARRSLEVIKRLEGMKELEMRYSEVDFPEIKDLIDKLIRLARLESANILTGDLSRIQQSTIESTEGIRIINLKSLANALKPLTHSGEVINIKIQRYGKESRQGVGYLEDGTMVVVNGGAEYLGETIKAHVLSVKHTSSGRMIFCNAFEDEEELDEDIPRANEHFLYAGTSNASFVRKSVE